MKNKPRFIFNKHHVQLQSTSKTSHQRFRHWQTVQGNPNGEHLSSLLPLWFQSLFSTSSSGSPSTFLPSVLSLDQILCSCRTRHSERTKVISRLTFQIYTSFSTMLSKSLGGAINAVWLFIRIGQSQTSILLRLTFRKLSNVVFCSVSMVYLWLILMLTWHCMTGSCRGRNVVSI